MTLNEIAYRMVLELRRRFPGVSIADIAAHARTLPEAEIEDIRSAARWSGE